MLSSLASPPFRDVARRTYTLKYNRKEMILRGGLSGEEGNGGGSSFVVEVELFCHAGCCEGYSDESPL